MRIFADQNIPFAQSLFSFAGKVTLFDGRALQNQDLYQCDILLVRSVTKVNAALLENTPVQWVGTATAGTNHIDTQYLEQQQIPFFAAPGSNAQSVAEYVLSTILHLKKLGKFTFKDTVGIVGYGEVGSRLAHLLNVLNIPWVAVDPLRQEKTKEHFLQPYTALSECQHISFHVPLTQNTHATLNMVNDSLLQSFEQCQSLINTCRGEIFIEKEVSTFVQKNKITLVADVFWDEPSPSPEYRQQTLWNTPHIAGYATQAKINGSLMLQQTLAKTLKQTIPPSEELITNKEIDLSDSSKESILFDAVQNCYSVIEDHNQFQKHTNSSPIFDTLRKEYPLRHQFQNCILQLPKWSKPQFWKKLGFQIK